MARVAKVVNDVRTAVGADNVLLVDAGDEMQGSLLSNLQKGAPTIATFNAMGYAVATFGNHEFDWGKPILISRTTQATYPYVTRQHRLERHRQLRHRGLDSRQASPSPTWSRPSAPRRTRSRWRSSA